MQLRISIYLFIYVTSYRILILNIDKISPSFFYLLFLYI